jgi:hypothetical protein
VEVVSVTRPSLLSEVPLGALEENAQRRDTLLTTVNAVGSVLLDRAFNLEPAGCPPGKLHPAGSGFAAITLPVHL